MATRAILHAVTSCLDPAPRVAEAPDIDRVASCQVGREARSPCVQDPCGQEGVRLHSSASHLGRHKSQVAPFARCVTRYVVRAGDKWTTKSFADYTWGTGAARYHFLLGVATRRARAPRGTIPLFCSAWHDPIVVLGVATRRARAPPGRNHQGGPAIGARHIRKQRECRELRGNHDWLPGSRAT